MIALDYDSSAQKISEAGYDLARSMNARTISLHVTSNATYYSSLNYSAIMGFENFGNLIQTDTAGELNIVAQKYLDSSKRHLGDETIQTIVDNGDFGEAILGIAAGFKVDIIVMGTHSRRGLAKMLLGSVAEKVLHNCPIPLFIIPTKSLEDR